MTQPDVASEVVPPEWVLPEKFTVRFTMKSDWHIGTGTGRPGNIDRLIARDAQGFPLIPAKSVTGIWRDACEQVAYALDEKTSGEWSDLVDLVFGTQPAIKKIPELKPQPAWISIDPARLNKSVRDLLSQHPESKRFKAMLTIVKPGVAIDSNTGMAIPDCLRFEEMGRKGLVLEAECHLPDFSTKDLRQAASAILTAGARLVELVGGKRRRGAGKCLMEIQGLQNQDGAFLWLEQNQEPPHLELTTCRQSKSVSLVDGTSKTWVEIPLILELETPLVVGAKTLGNITETLDFIPGTYLLPFITRTLEQLGVTCRQPIVNGDLLVTPATMEIEGQRSFSVPSVLARHKEGGGFSQPKTVINRLLESPPEGIQTKPYREGFITRTLSGTLPQYATVSHEILTHNTVADENQRPNESVGGLYSRKAISSGVRFRAILRLRQGLHEQLINVSPHWWGNLQGRYRFGISSKDDYGAVMISTPAEEPKGFKSTSASIPDNRLVVWLVSDVLLRGKTLRPTTAAEILGQELGKKLGGVTLTPYEPPREKKCIGRLIRTQRIESWQTQWGLPRSSLMALAAGSVITFQSNCLIDPLKLQELEASGIGERRGEGYGQLVFNEPLLCNPISNWNGVNKIPNLPSTEHQPEPSDSNQPQSDGQNGNSNLIDPNHPNYDLACKIEQCLWREAIQRQVLQRADSAKNREDILGIHYRDRESVPPMSQLGALRSVVQQITSFEDRERSLSWIRHLRETKNRSDKWPDERDPVTQRPTKLKGVEQLFATESRIWEVMGWVTEPPTLTSDGSQRLKNQFWAETVRSLIEACIRAHKRELEGR